MHNALGSPYDCVGLVYSFFKKEESPVCGSGFLIDGGIVLTAAHTVCRRSNVGDLVLSDKVFFLPAVNGWLKKN